MQKTQSLAKPCRANLTPRIFYTGLLLLAGTMASQAQTTQIKANNTTALTTGASWVSGSVPGSTGIGQWNSTVTAANTVALGGPLGVGELQILNPGGNVSISDATAANILTLNGVNSVGLDLSAATRSLTIGAGLSIGSSQTWNIKTGQSVTLNGANGLALGANVLTISGGAFNVNYASTETTVSSSSVGAGLVISNTAVALSAVSATSSATAGIYFGLNPSLTVAGNNTWKDTAPSTTGNHTQSFTSLTLNPGVTLFSTGTRGSSSGISVGFAALNRDGGSLADVSGANNNTFGGSVEAYALPGSAVVGGITTGGTDWALPAGATTDLKTATYVNDAWAAGNNTTVTVNSSLSSATTGSLKFGAAGAFTLTFAGLNTITTGGILVNSTVGANATTLTGGSLTSGNANADGTSDLIVINNDSAAGSSVVINSIIADNGATSVGLTAGSTLAAVPAGAIQLNAANTFSGSTYITVGTLLLGNPLALQNSTFNTTTAGTLNFGTLTTATFGGLAGSGNLTLPAGFALTVGNNNKNGTVTGAILQAGSTPATLTKVGTGTLMLDGANTYLGLTTISGGTLALGATGSFAGPSSVSSGATLDVSAAGNYSLASSLSGAGTVNGNLTLAAGGQLAPLGATGTLTLNNNLTFGSGTAAITFNGSAQHGVITIGGNLTLTGGTVQVINNGAALANGTYKIVGVPSGTISGLGSALAVSGFDQPGQAAALVANAGELDLVVATYVSQNLLWVGDGGGSGLWNVNSDADWYDNTSAAISVFHNADNTTFDDTSANQTVNLTGTLSPNTVTVNGTKNYTFTSTGAIGGSASLVDNNSGTLTVLTVNSYSGGTTISGSSTLQVGNGTAAGSLGSGPVVDNATLTYDLPAGSQTEGAISGSGNLNVTGTGSVVLNGADTLAGTTTVTTGTLKQGAANVLPNGPGAGNIAVNGTLDLAGLNGSVNQLSGLGTIDTKAAGVPVFTVTGGGDFGGTIQDTAGSLAVNVNGSGLTLELTNGTYTGGTTVTAGTLQFGTATAIGGGSLTVGTAGTVDLNGFSPTIDYLSGAGLVDNVSAGGTVTLTIGNNNGNGTFSGIIQSSSGTVALTKAGAGTETLTGDNSYTGTTTVNGGTLAIATNGTINSTTLAGNGFLVNGGSVNASGTSTFNSSANAFLETSGTVSVGTFAGNANDGTLIEITGGSFTANLVTLPRSAGNTTAPTAAAPIAAPTGSGFYVDGASALVNLGALTIATENSSASARLDAGSLSVSGETRVGDQSGGRWDILQVNGGFFNDSDTANGVVIAGNDGANSVNAEVYFSGPSTNEVGIINFGLASDTLGGVGWLFVNGGASLYLGSGGIVKPNAAGLVATTELTSGLLGASANWSSSLNLNLNGTNFTLQPADASGNAYNISLSGTLTIGANSSALTISGFPGGAGGTVFLTGANQYNGGTLVTNATVAINGIYALGGGNYDGLTLNDGTLQYTNLGYPANGTYDLTTGTNSIKLGALGGIIDVNGNTVTYTNAIAGAGSLTVVSTVTNGVLTFLTNNAYTGGTIIGNNNTQVSGNGTLSVNNTTGSGTGPGNVTVEAGGTLTGGGSISGAVEIQRGAFLAPGNGLGTLTVGALTLDSGGFGNFEIGVSGNDQTVVTAAGGLVINDGSDNFAFNLYAAGGTAPWSTPGTYKLIQFSGAAPSLDSSWTTSSGTNPHVANAQPSSVYSFGISGGFLTVTIAGNGTSVAGTWTNPAGGNWATAANWSSNPNVPHSAGDSATFGTATGLNTVTLNANETVGVITFNNGNSFDIANGGHTLTLDNAILPADIYALAGTANQIQAPLALNDNTAISLSSGVNLTVSGAIANAPTASQPETLSVTGAGTLVLAGNNTYGPAAASGFGTTLGGGATVKVASSTALAAGDVSVAGNSTVQAGAAGVNLPNNFDVASGTTVTVDANGQTLTLNGNITDSGNLTKIGQGTLALNGANNSYSGVTTVDAGVLSVAGSGNLQSSASVNLDGGDLLGNGTFSFGPNIGLGAPTGTASTNGLIDAAAGQVFTISGVISSAGNTGTNGLVVNSQPGSTGTVVLEGANLYNGQTVVANGVLDLQAATALQNSTLNYNNQGGTLVFDSIAAATLGGLTGGQSLALTNVQGGAVTLSVGNNNTSNNYTGDLNDGGLGGALIKVGTATQTLSGTNILTGNLTVNGGTLELPAGGYLFGNLLGGAGFLVDGGTLINSNSPATTPSTFTGGAAIVETAGTVITPGVFRTSNNDGTLFAVYGGYFSAGTVTMQRTLNNGTVVPTAAAPLAASTTSGMYVDSTNPASPAVVNLGYLIIGTANSSCSFREDAGTVVVTNYVLVGDTSNTRFDILQVNGGTFTSLDTNNGIVLAENNGTTENNAELYLSGGTTYAQLISFGAATDTLTDTNIVIVSGGSLFLGSGGITNANTTGLDYYQIDLNSGLLGALGNLTITNNLQLSSTNFTFQAADNNGVSHTISLGGVINGPGGLIKSGAGQLTLANNADTWTGATAITNGTLALTGLTGISNSPAIALAAPGILSVAGRSDGTFPLGTVAAQTLEGNGTITGNLAVGSLGTVAPGALAGSPATLTVSGSVKLGGASLFNLNRAGTPTSDEVVSPAITAGGTLIVTNLGAALHVGDTFQLFSTPVSGAFATVTLPASDSVNKAYTWSNKLAVNGTIVVLTAVPNVNTNPTNITATVAGGVLTLSWPADHTGWTLQAQTNSLSTGLSGNWVSVPGSTAVDTTSYPIDPTKGTVFYRLVYTNTP